ncbi:MAG: retropepsin-like aspartic protease [Cyanobacteria bacterium P01_H01_bin.74]
MLKSTKTAILSASLVSLVLASGHQCVALSPQAQEAANYFYTLAQQSDNPLIAGFARENYNKLKQEKGLTRRVRVALMSQPDASLAVPVIIDHKVMATFMVDTGASYTVITPRMAKKLGVIVTPETPRVTLMTGNGMVNAPKVKLKNISIGKVTVPEVSAVVQQLGDGHDLLLSGLLGLNFFKGMGFSVQGSNLILDVPQPVETSMLP